MPTEAEIVDAKSIIQSEVSALQDVKDAIARSQEAHDASILEADKLKKKEIAAILELYDAQTLQLTASWKQKREELDAQMREIEGRLARQREFIAPMKRLPYEVLSGIFTAHVDCGGTPWTLLRVCRLWKAVTTSTPRTWRFIQIANNERQFDSGTSFQNCFTNAHVEKALSRTGAAPLHISVALRHLGDIRERAADSNRIFALFGTLTKVLGRCDSFELKGVDRAFSAEDYDLFAPLQFPILSSLNSLCIGYGWAGSGIPQKLLVASNHEIIPIREFSLTDYSYSLVGSLVNHQILFKQLLRFSATRFRVPKDVFAAMRSLTCLSLTANDLNLPELSSVADLLEKAEFFNTTFLQLSTHQFSNLKELILRSCTIPMQPGAIKAPVLDTLVFTGESWLPLLVFDCPSLSHLELEEGPSTKTEAKKELNQIWGPGRGFVHLKTLKVHLVTSDAVLIAILKKLVALERLSLIISQERNQKRAVTPGDTFFNSLHITNPRRLGFLQNLRTLSLHIDCSYLLDSDDTECSYSPESDGLLKRLRAGIKGVVRSRQRAAPLWSAALEVLKWEWSGSMVTKEEFVVCEEKQ